MKKSSRPSSVAILHPSLFTALEIERFEKEILFNPKATERDASDFFLKFPKFLLLGQGKEVRREVVLIDPNGDNRYRVDFFRKRYGSTYWDMVELKHPKKRFLSNSGKHIRLGSDVIAAINQAEDYRDRIMEDASLRADLLQKGIAVYRPQILVVVGKHDNQLSPEVMEILYDRVRRGHVEARSYDDLYAFAKDHYAASQFIIVLKEFDANDAETSKSVSEIMREIDPDFEVTEVLEAHHESKLSSLIGSIGGDHHRIAS
jgi:hypothetical protein